MFSKNTHCIEIIWKHLCCHQVEELREHPCSKPQLKDLMDALYHKVADKWRTIGLYLEIPKGKLSGTAEKVSR